ncbi:unnamed protein product, partial [Rotaria sordida]
NNNEKPEFRYVSSQNGIKPSSYTQYAVPKDIADISRARDFNKLADVLSSRTCQTHFYETTAHSDFYTQYRPTYPPDVINRILNYLSLKYTICDDDLAIDIDRETGQSYVVSQSGSQHFLKQYPESTVLDDLRLEIFKCLDIFDDEYELDLSFDTFTF